MTPKRQLVSRYLDLPHVRRVEALTELGLTEPGDKGIFEPDRSAAYFQRATDRNLLAEFWDAVESRHEKPNPYGGPGNPFRKTPGPELQETTPVNTDPWARAKQLVHDLRAKFDDQKLLELYRLIEGQPEQSLETKIDTRSENDR